VSASWAVLIGDLLALVSKSVGQVGYSLVHRLFPVVALGRVPAAWWSRSR
jgi:hypothetical protein